MLNNVEIEVKTTIFSKWWKITGLFLYFLQHWEDVIINSPPFKAKDSFAQCFIYERYTFEWRFGKFSNWITVITIVFLKHFNDYYYIRLNSSSFWPFFLQKCFWPCFNLLILVLCVFAMLVLISKVCKAFRPSIIPDRKGAIVWLVLLCGWFAAIR